MNSKINDSFLRSYIRNKYNETVGVVVAVKRPNGVVAVAVSKANVNKGDKFNKELGVQIAVDRALEGSNSVIHSSVVKDVNIMVGRAIKYFRTNEVEIAGDVIRS